jgi:hypothetical protein
MGRQMRTSRLASHSNVCVLALHLRKSCSELYLGRPGKVKVLRPNQIKQVDVCCFNSWIYSLLTPRRRQCDVSSTRRAYVQKKTTILNLPRKSSLGHTKNITLWDPIRTPLVFA